jgi:hypothetical protein
VLKTIQEEKFSPGVFTVTHESVVPLHPQLARRVVGLIDLDEGLRPQMLEFAQLLEQAR